MFAWLKSLFAGKVSVSVSIPVADTFPNEEELNVRNRITDALDELGIGSFVGAGGGFDQMDFEYRVTDLERAKQLIAQVMEQHLPGKDYEIMVD